MMLHNLLTGDACSVGELYAHPLVEAVLGGSLHPGGIDLSLELAKRAAVAPEDHLLDVGCGKGASTWAVAHATGCTATGIDVSAASIAAARAGGPDGMDPMGPVGARVDFQVLTGALGALPGRYDAVLSECALCLQDSGTLDTFHALLRPGGRLLLSDVTVEAPAASFRSAAGFVACLGGARDHASLVAEVEGAGFIVEQVDNRAELVAAVRDRIHARVDVHAVVGALGDKVDGLARLVQEAEAALAAGHLGYAVIVARKP